MLLHRSDRELNQQEQNLDEAGILQKKRVPLQKLAKLAHFGLLLQGSKQQLFTEEDITKHCLTEEEMQCGLITAYVSAVSDSFLPILKKTFSFPHLIQQEWLCALKLMQVYSNHLYLFVVT